MRDWDQSRAGLSRIARLNSEGSGCRQSECEDLIGLSSELKWRFGPQKRVYDAGETHMLRPLGLLTFGSGSG